MFDPFTGVSGHLTCSAGPVAFGSGPLVKFTATNGTHEHRLGSRLMLKFKGLTDGKRSTKKSGWDVS